MVNALPSVLQHRTQFRRLLGGHDGNHAEATVECARHFVRGHPADTLEPMADVGKRPTRRIDFRRKAVRQDARHVIDQSASGDMSQRLDAAGANGVQTALDVDPGGLKQDVAQQPAVVERRRRLEVRTHRRHDSSNQGKAVGMQAVRGKAKNDIAGGGGRAGERLAALHGADSESRQVIVPLAIHSRHFCRFAADQSASGAPAAFRNAGDDRLGYGNIQLAGGEIIKKKQRLRPLNHKIVDAHGNQINSDAVMTAHRGGQLELRSDAVGRGDKDGISVAGSPDVEETGKAAKLGDNPGARRRAGERLDRLHQCLTGIDIDTRITIAMAADVFLLYICCCCGKERYRYAARTLLYPGPYAMRLRRPQPVIFALLWAGTLYALAALVPGPAQAVVLEVTGVEVDITAESAAEAREQAIVVAQRKAFEKLVADVTGGGAAPNLGDAEIAALVHDFSITNEKSSAVRYIGTFDFRFDRTGVRNVVGEFAAPTAAATPEPVVIVPVYQSDAGMTLWDEPNPWRHAWAKHASSSHVVPTLVPFGDLEDVTTLGPEDAIGGDTDRLLRLAQRYSAETAFVAIAAINTGEPPLLTVTTVRHDAEGPGSPLVETFEAGPGESVDNLLDRAAAAVHANLQVQWRQGAVVAARGPAVLGVVVPISGLSDWLSVRNRLQNQRLIKETDLITLSREEVRLNLHYLGDLSELTEALQHDGLDLVQDGERWTLLPDRN